VGFVFVELNFSSLKDDLLYRQIVFVQKDGVFQRDTEEDCLSQKGKTEENADNGFDIP